MTTGKVAAIAKSMLGSGVSSAVADYLDEHPDIFTDYAKVDGSYSSLTAGNAEQLVSTVGVTGKTPYLFRTTGGSADVGDRVKLSEITGGTVAWNQLVQNGNFATTDGWNIYGASNFSVSDGIASCTGNNTGSIGQVEVYRPCTAKANHVLLAMVDVFSTESISARFRNPLITTPFSVSANAWTKIASIKKPDENGTQLSIQTSSVSGMTLKLRNLVMFDLTAMFGSTIADYLYGLESGTAGAGVAKLKSWGFCTKPYYAYDAGSLLSVKTSAHRTVGFNQWDEEWELGTIGMSTGQKIDSNDKIRSKNYVPILPNTTYYFKMPINWRMCYYDANKNLLENGNTYDQNRTLTSPDGAYYLRFAVDGTTTYANNVCINLHWDGERDGEYEPYEANTYALDDVELRGIPKLDANNNLYYDGDSYAPDGTVTRKYATRSYGEGDATDGSTMITDGTNTIYKLTTPTTESADPYQETQVCNDFGTEEFVDERTVPMPVGANALYQANLRAKLEMAPDSPSGNGDYIVRQTDGLNEYVPLEKELPSAPAEDGTYSLKCTVADGTATLSWVSDT